MFASAGIVLNTSLMARAPKPSSTAAVIAPDSEIVGREALRAIILSKAGTIVATEGLAAVQARRLAAEGGCSVGTLYNIFGDRDGLILAINRETMTAMGHPLGAARKASAKSSLEARLLSLLEETIGADVPDNDQRRTAARALFGAAHGILHLAINNRLSDFDPRDVERDVRFIVKAAAAGMRKKG
jgi:AcrR family transcriptional regulator